jgi:hypothetical protein
MNWRHPARAVAVLAMASAALGCAATGPTPTPTPVPTVAPGHLCVAATTWIDTCDGLPSEPTFTAADSLTFRIESPIYDDIYITMTISKVENGKSTPIKRFDIQAIPNPDGVWNEIGPVSRLGPATAAGAITTYRLDADSEGRHIADTTFTVTAGPASMSPGGEPGSPTPAASFGTTSGSAMPSGGSLQIHTELPLPSDALPFCLTASLGGPHRLTVSGTDLVLVDINTGEPTMIVWPYGFVARLVDGKAELVAPDGSVVAREGDLLNVGGGFALPGFHVCEINGTTYANGQTW